MHNLRIQPVDQSNLGELQAFARTFDHELEPCEWPLYEAHNMGNGKRLGYFFVTQHPIIYPSVHPHCTPREVLEIGRMVKGRVEMFGKNAAVLVPQRTETFTPRIMQHLGFRGTDLLLYVS